uniref:Uncharacterized protein n=1 Tax=Arundo donax TaxID=35708 RepID=A0A0A9UAI9_ARUDO
MLALNVWITPEPFDRMQNSELLLPAWMRTTWPKFIRNHRKELDSSTPLLT